ncbi:MAG: TolC family protein [Polyangiales bacterium]
MMRAVCRAAFMVAWLFPWAAGASDEERTLRFEDVKRSVAEHDPRIREAIGQLQAAEGDVMAARGAFDPRIEGDGKILTGGYYDLRDANVEVRQPTTVWGSEVFLGYRVGLANNDRWPTYRDNETLSGGEVRAGIDVPIWRGGMIDEERARRSRAIRLEEAAGYALSATELDLELAAAKAYWSWVRAGQSRVVAADLMHLAEERDSQLRRRLAAGSIAEFDVVDNERILLERQSILVGAERALEQASYELSLFLRDANGNSVLPRPEQLPAATELESFEPIASEIIIDQVLRCHPELNEARAELEAIEVDRALARNRLAPEIRAYFEYSRDLGELTGTTFDFTLPGNVYETGVVLSMPLLFRSDRGRARSALAKVEVKRANVRFLEDQLRARTRDAASGLRAAEARVGLAEGMVRTAAELEKGERRRFEVGSSNLVFVNLREQQAALARVKYIDAVAVSAVERTRWEVTTDVTCN